MTGCIFAEFWTSSIEGLDTCCSKDDLRDIPPTLSKVCAGEGFKMALGLDFLGSSWFSDKSDD